MRSKIKSKKYNKYKFRKVTTRKYRTKNKKIKNYKKTKKNKRITRRKNKKMRGGFFSQNTLNYKTEIIDQADQIKDRTINSAKSSLGNVVAMGGLAFKAGLSATKDAATAMIHPFKKEARQLQNKVNQQVNSVINTPIQAANQKLHSAQQHVNTAINHNVHSSQ